MQNYVENMCCSLFLFKTGKILFWVNLVKKNKSCPFKLKFGAKTNLNKWNSKTMFTYSVFDHKYLSWSNLVQKFKIVCSILMQRIIRICKFQRWCLFYLLQTEIATHFGKFGAKNRNWQFKLKMDTFNSDVHFLTRSILFFGNLFQKSKLFVEAEIQNLD